MGYWLGIDFGTTYTAVAVYHQGRPEIVALGSRTPEVPSVVYLGPDGPLLAGEAANRRGVTDPAHAVAQFKRCIGDMTPLMVAGAPYSAEALTAKLLGWVVDVVQERLGGPPERIAISHPAHWGPQKQDSLSQAAQMAGLDDPLMLTDPEAAAISSASLQRMRPGETVAVYDLGGGTFDAAVLRTAAGGSVGSFEVLGLPQGIERLGGVDFDEAILGHVDQALGGALGRLDSADPVTAIAIARLRQECAEAKEALSSDVEVSIPVFLPQMATQVQLGRPEFEAMIRPAISETIEAVKRALHSAGVAPDELGRFLLVGGSARIPLVAQMLSAELGRAVAVDARPTHAVALGAALAARRAAARGSVRVPPSQPEPEVSGTDDTPSAGAVTVPPVPVAAALEVQPTHDPATWLLQQAAVATDEPPLLDEHRPARSLPFPPSADGAFVPPLKGQHAARGSHGRPRRGRTRAFVGALALGAFLLLLVRWLGSSAPDPLTARINGITVEGGRYVVDWEPSGFTSALNGAHVHFYFDAVPPDQAGVPGQGPWWEHGPGRPFTGWGPIDRPQGATQLCVVVANPDHTVRPGSGGCAPLP